MGDKQFYVTKKSKMLSLEYSYINNCDTNNLLDQIRNWNEINLATATTKEIRNQLLKIAVFVPIKIYTPRAVSLYRVRKNENGELFRKFKEVYYPAQNIIKSKGRLNEAGEQFLYLSKDMVTPIFEAKILPGELFTHVSFSIKKSEQIRLAAIEYSDYPKDKLTMQGIINVKIIANFLINEFRKPVGVGTEYLYRATIEIMRNFYDIPEIDGWAYPSIITTKGLNVALKKDSADKKMEFSKLGVGELISLQGKSGAITNWKNKSNSIKDGDIIYVA